MSKKKVQQFYCEVPVDLTLKVKVKVEAANEQEALGYAVQRARDANLCKQFAAYTQKVMEIRGFLLS
jgi:hypothetical protein